MGKTMLANDKGNLREVYLGTADERRLYEQCMNDRPSPHQLEAEITEGAQGAWIVVIAYPGQDGIASGHLIGRRFGVYQPRFPKSFMRRGRLVETMRPMFPNYLFVRVWDISRHIRRILACTGVQTVLHVGEKVAVVPWSEINEIRAAENAENPFSVDDSDGAVAAFEERVRKEKQKRKRKNKKSKRHQEIKESEIIDSLGGHPNDVVGSSSWGFKFGSDQTDEQRVSELHRALGLTA